jgi:hypothetical protein
METMNYELGAFEIVAYRREWDGDISDFGCYVYIEAGEEFDNYGIWEPLYAWIPNAELRGEL